MELIRYNYNYYGMSIDKGMDHLAMVFLSVSF